MSIEVTNDWTVWRDDEHFTKNPDVVPLEDGRLLCVFCLTDHHSAQEYAHITLLESTDEGRTWEHKHTISESYPEKEGERWITPRITRLDDGRLIVLCDRDGYEHETLPDTGIHMWWSEDGGDNWNGGQPAGIPGYENDRVRELDDGTLLVASQQRFVDTQRLGMVAVRSEDGGDTWGHTATIASDHVHHYCEGNVFQVDSGELVCVMRENNHRNYPSYVSVSRDRGRTWTPPVRAPFSGDRPFVDQLRDGRILATFRNTGGQPGTYAWIGDLDELLHDAFAVAQWSGIDHEVATTDNESLKRSETGPATRPVDLTDEGLTIDGGEGMVRYLLYPPENEWCSLSFRARVRCEGDADERCGHLHLDNLDVDVEIDTDGVNIDGQRPKAKVDMDTWRDLLVRYDRGRFDVYVDDERVQTSFIDWVGSSDARTYFGNDEDCTGTITYSGIEYNLENDRDADHSWHWDADTGGLPDSYASRRWVPIERNTNPSPDHGYSTWTQLDDGRVLVLDYTNKNAAPGKAYLKGYYMKVS